MCIITLIGLGLGNCKYLTTEVTAHVRIDLLKSLTYFLLSNGLSRDRYVNKWPSHLIKSKLHKIWMQLHVFYCGYIIGSSIFKRLNNILRDSFTGNIIILWMSCASEGSMKDVGKINSNSITTNTTGRCTESKILGFYCKQSNHWHVHRVFDDTIVINILGNLSHWSDC